MNIRNIAPVVACYFAALCWATSEATAGLISGGTPLPNPVITEYAAPIGNATPIAHAKLMPVPTATADVSIEGIGAANAVASLRYQVLVNGPTPNVMVPLQMESTVSWFQVGLTNATNFVADAQIWEGSPPGQPLNIVNGLLFQSGDTLPTGGGSSTTLVSIGAFVGTPFTVEVDATSEVSTLDPFGGVSDQTVLNVVADPVISFAPGFDSTGYTLQFSPGVGNATVPEPSTLTLLGIAAVWSLGYGWRKRRISTQDLRTPAPSQSTGLQAIAQGQRSRNPR
jgi:PEP-CTERM motif